jgi:hypothetical protein
MCKAYMNSTNITGGRGWHLTILPTGALVGNGARDSLAEWSFLMLQQQTGRTGLGLETPAMVLAPQLLSPNSLASPPPAAAASNVFPGLGAGREELMKFFGTPAGVDFLQQSEYKPAYDLFQRGGLLSKILHRPDWPYLASRFRDYPKDGWNDLAFSQPTVDHFAPFHSVKQFFEQGWTTVSNAVTPEAIGNAKKIMNFWNFKYMNTALQQQHLHHHHHHSGAFNGLKRGRGYTVECIGDISTDMDLLALYYNSPLPHIMCQLFGVGEVDNPKHARPLMVFPTLDLTDDPALFGDKWTIDGFTKDSHSPYNIVIGIALNDLNDTDQVRGKHF